MMILVKLLVSCLISGAVADPGGPARTPCGPAACAKHGNAVVCCGPAASTKYWTAGDVCGRPTTCGVIASAGGSAPVVLCLTGDQAYAAAAPPADQPAGVWIGVSLTPVPEPLAAHLNRSGLMITNVVVDSPADEAGLERYDVIVSFNDQPIETMEDLSKAISDVGDGAEADMTVIHAGEQKTLKITPANRPEGYAYNYRYEQPESVVESGGARYFGHQLRRDENGNWVLEPLGRLGNLPDEIRERLRSLPPPGNQTWVGRLDELDAKDWKKWAEQWEDWARVWEDLKDEDFTFEFKPDDLPGLYVLPRPDHDQQITIVRTQDDGSSIKIERHRDGTIDVERTDTDGNKQSATYQSADELREDDPDAHRMLRGHVGSGIRAYVAPPPVPDRLAPMQRDFQRRLRERLEKQEQLLRDTERQAREIERRLRAQAEKRVARSEARASASDGESVSVSVTYDADSGYALDITENGVKKHFEFQSLDEFREAEPDLYKRFKDLLEGAAGSP